MNYGFHPETEEEFFAAIDYYESCELGLGYDFAIETYAAINRVVNSPETWPRVVGPIHRCLLKRFPYGVLYAIQDGTVLIIAVMHLPRRGRTTVEGAINGHSFQATLEPDGRLSHWLKVSKKLQEAASDGDWSHRFRATTVAPFGPTHSLRG